MDALDALSVEQLASLLKTKIESTLHNGQDHMGFSLSDVLAIERDLAEALSNIRWIRNTFAPINKLHPELLAAITTYVDDPFGVNSDCADLQFFCATVCRHWRNSLLSYPSTWSSIDTTNSRHMKLYLTRSKKAPLSVNYGWMTPPSVFEEHIIPERHRLRSLSIPLGQVSYQGVTRSLSGAAKSLRALDMWMVYQHFPIPAVTMETISRFSPNITVLRLHDIFTSLASLKFHALVKLTFRATMPTTPNLDTMDFIKFLRNSPLLEELDLRLPDSFKADRPASPVTLARLKSAVFNGSLTPNNSVGVNVLPYLILPKQSITVDVQTRARAFSADTSPLLSVIQLGDAIFPRQSITAAVIHIKDNPSGFLGHVSVRGEHNNWIGLNHVRVLNLGGSPLSRLHNWFDPVGLAPFHGIRTLTLGLFEFVSDEERCVEVLRTFLKGLDQVRVLNVHKMNVSLVARLLQPSDGTMLLPLLEELRLRPYHPPELTRAAAHDEVQPGPSRKAGPPQGAQGGWEIDQEGFRIKEWRQVLQKVLFNREPIEEKDIHACDEIFKQLEDYDEMTAGLLSFTKIGKAMRHISNMDEIPRQEEFRFQERARVLTERWFWPPAAGASDHAKCSAGGMDANSPVLHDMIRARRRCIAGGLKGVIVENASGRATSVILP